ncbi:unnamed protein product [Rotaria sordida]|uniref:Uncharacterized protein n=1 Tax=Rotaria sordida TaxID=392033 RepID=A0A819SGZ2_9BILA|nr:unnamed protein product [Rotaria sordida]
MRDVQLLSITYVYLLPFDIDRSIIRLLDRNNQKLDNRPSTNRVVRIRTEDILGSIEYRELETQKKTFIS